MFNKVCLLSELPRVIHSVLIGSRDGDSEAHTGLRFATTSSIDVALKTSGCDRSSFSPEAAPRHGDDPEAPWRAITGHNLTREDVLLKSAGSEPTSQESLLRLLFEQAPGFVCVLGGPGHVYTLVNPAYDRLFGPREFIGKQVCDAIPEAVTDGFMALLDAVYKTGKPFVGRRAPLALRRGNDGSIEPRFLDFVYQPLLDRAGKVTGIFCQGHDVTETVEAEVKLRVEADKLAAQALMFDTVLSSIEDFAYAFDRDGRFTYLNKPLLDLLGLASEQVVGKTFLELPYPTELAEQLHSQIHEVVESRKQVRGDTFYASPSGTGGWYEYIFNPVFALDGAVVTVTGSTRDVTLRRDTENRLAALNESERAARAEAERAGRLKDEFLATLSHELRTPLNSIQSWAHLLRSGRLTQEQAKDAVERISRSSSAQGQLIADLLDINGIASGKVRLTIERVPLAKPLLGALDSVALDAAAKKVALQWPQLDTTLLIDCDPGRLQQVFWNLLTNAVKFTPSAGTVTAAVQWAADSVTVTVSDTGIGVGASFIPHLFERFSQEDSSSTRTYGGLGLGLSISKSLVEMHGGQIAVSSAGEPSGATFSVTLPRKQVHITTESASAWGSLEDADLPSHQEVMALQGARILVVDDDVEGRVALATVLRQYGAIVVEAGDADEAFDKLQAQVPALIICDIGMPVIDGYQLLWRIRKNHDIPAVAFTAFARDEDKQRALASGFVTHIAKPSAPAVTIRICAEILRRTQATR